MLEHLRGLREDNELTQTDLARLLNVSQSTYSDYEHEKLNIPINSLKKLALYFHTSVDYIIDFTNERTPYSRTK